MYEILNHTLNIKDIANVYFNVHVSCLYRRLEANNINLDEFISFVINKNCIYNRDKFYSFFTNDTERIIDGLWIKLTNYYLDKEKKELIRVLNQ